jgi:hypothetical protein
MNIRSILTRGHWLKTSEGKHGLIFLETKKDRLVLIYLINDKVSRREVTVINMKYDRVTEKYYIQYTPNEYLQLQLLKPEEHRIQQRILKNALEMIADQVSVNSDIGSSNKVKEELIQKALQSTTKANQPLSDVDKIGFYYLGKAIYLGLELLDSKGKSRKQAID